MGLTRRKSKGRADSDSYFAFPHAVLNCPELRNLSGSATKVLLVLCNQLRKYNNGDLSAPFSTASQWGIGSKSTLAKALRELEKANLICRTRTAVFQNPAAKCTLFAVTWRAIDECKGKLEISATTTPIRQFSLRGRTAVPSTASVPNAYTSCTEHREMPPDG